MDVDDHSKLQEEDLPPPSVEFPPGFSADPDIVAEISSALQVNPQWVVHACLETREEVTRVKQTKEEIFAWVLENHPRFVELDPFPDEPAGKADEDGNSLKMVIVVNNEVPMSPGKMAGQVAHAAVELYALLISDKSQKAAVDKWVEEGSKKIVVKCKDTEELFDLNDDARNAGLKCAQTVDAGHTQIPSGSVTCLAVFGLSSEVNKVTGNLALMP